MTDSQVRELLDSADLIQDAFDETWVYLERGLKVYYYRANPSEPATVGAIRKFSGSWGPISIGLPQAEAERALGIKAQNWVLWELMSYEAIRFEDPVTGHTFDIVFRDGRVEWFRLDPAYDF